MVESRGAESTARYLAAFRAPRAGDAEAKAANREAIARRLAEGDLGPPTSAPERAASSRVAGLAMVVKSTAVALTLGAGGVGAVYGGALAWREVVATQPPGEASSGEADSAKRSRRQGADAKHPGAAPSAGSDAPPPPAADAALAPETRRTMIQRPGVGYDAADGREGPSPGEGPRARAGQPAPAPTAPQPDALAMELALMEAAEADLAAHRYRGLLRRLDEHRRLFPEGALAMEQRAWRAIALCALGRDEAPRAAAAFARAGGSAALAAKVADACERASKASPEQTVPARETRETDSATSPDEGT